MRKCVEWTASFSLNNNEQWRAPMAVAFNIDEEAQRMMAEAAAVPFLAKREEQELIAAVKAGGAAGERAKTKIVAAHQRLVIKIAKRFAWCGKPLSDLIQEGNIGVLNALRKFDASHGTRFSTFAIWDIRERIQMCALDRGQAMYIPPKAVKTIAKIKRREGLAAVTSGGRAVINDEAEAADLDISVKELKRLRTAGQSVASLNTPVSSPDSKGHTEFGDLLADPNAVIAESRIADVQLRELLEGALAELTPRERDIVVGRFEFNGDDEESLEILAQRHTISRERVRQIQIRSLEKLAKGPYAARLRSFLSR
jgi:RNA polymerase sigma factor (sigma-70 family)